MKYQITIETKALKDIAYFKKRDKIIFNKIMILLDELAEHPFIGTGKPEVLKFELSGYWSRRITKEYRLVYEVRGNKISVLNCRYHYSRN